MNLSSPVYRTSEIREIERAALADPATADLMERAGRSAAEAACEVLADGGRVLVLAGPGNNGGDALVVARHLKSWWYDVTVVFTGETSRLPSDAARAFAAWRAAGGDVVDAIPAGVRWGLVVDGLFGIGLQRDVDDAYREMIEAVNRLAAPVLALDIPSGLDSDTGRVRGVCVRARWTVTFIALKPGLLTLDGPDVCGEVRVCELGLDVRARRPPLGWRLGREDVAGWLPPRPRNSHKGTFGSVGVIGGARSMLGAALLAGRAALRTGAGRVYVGLLDPGLAVDPQQPELMLRDVDGVFQLGDLSCLVVGPGLGQSEGAALCLTRALEQRVPLVLDADALNLLARAPQLQARLRTRGGAVLTPHPAEAARLLDTTTEAVQSDRVAAALELANRCNAAVVIKGAGSVCAFTEGRWFINSSGNPGMASAGMGDVLAGMVASLVAQGLDPSAALLYGVHLHGAAADRLVAHGIGPAGLTASEVTDAARTLLNAWAHRRP